MSLCNEYGNLFECAYRMDYSSFQGLRDMLKDGIVEYIQGNESSPNNSSNRASSYKMEIYQQKFVLLVLYIILQVDHTSI